MGMRESEGCIRAMTPGNGYPPGPGRAKAARVTWPATIPSQLLVTA